MLAGCITNYMVLIARLLCEEILYIRADVDPKARNQRDTGVRDLMIYSFFLFLSPGNLLMMKIVTGNTLFIEMCLIAINLVLSFKLTISHI